MATTENRFLIAWRRFFVGGHADAAITFQPDAVEMERTPVPLAAVRTVQVIVAALVTAVLWAAWADIDRVVSARGKIITLAERIVVQPLTISQIKRIRVEAGQIVKAGTVLVELDPTFAQADVSQLTNRIESTNAQLERLRAEAESRVFVVDGKNQEANLQSHILKEREQQFDSSVRSLNEEIARLESTLKTNEDHAKGVSDSLHILSEQEAMRNRLSASNYVSRSDLLDIRRRRVEAETEVHNLESQGHELLHQLRKAQADKDTFVKDWKRKVAEDIVTTKRERDQSVDQLTKARQMNALVELRAPADAVVLEVAQRSAGSIAKEAEPLVTLIPLNSALELEVDILASDIGFISLGNPVRVKMDAFPFQKHGTLNGVLRIVSEDAFQKEDRNGTVALYRGRVAMKTWHLERVPSGFRPIPGMTVTAEIKVGERSVLSYLLYPLIQAIDEGMKEP